MTSTAVVTAAGSSLEHCKLRVRYASLGQSFSILFLEVKTLGVTRPEGFLAMVWRFLVVAHALPLG